MSYRVASEFRQRVSFTVMLEIFVEVSLESTLQENAWFNRFTT